MLEHGGNLNAAAKRYARPVEDWVDLSTGINPWAYPIPELPQQCWQNLPQDDDGLMTAAAAYYGNELLLPVAGSQAAIQALPHLFPTTEVGLFDPMYAEHTQAWQQAGHTLVQFDPLRALPERLTILVVCQPNNPTGRSFSRHQLLAWRDELVARGGLLVVDEAFIDCTPEDSLCAYAQQPGLVVLRSLGKFFGLAGARLGFVFSAARLLSRLRDALGPWPIAGPSRFVAQVALQDVAWQQQTRCELKTAGMRLQAVLEHAGLPLSGGCTLFQWLRSSQAANWHETLAGEGVWTRLFATPDSLRFGLPADENQWQRLQHSVSLLKLREEAA